MKMDYDKKLTDTMIGRALVSLSDGLCFYIMIYLLDGNNCERYEKEVSKEFDVSIDELREKIKPLKKGGLIIVKGKLGSRDKDIYYVTPFGKRLITRILESEEMS